MKKIIVLASSGRLANQLWHFAAVYAYCLEKGFECENYAFFRYWYYFNITISNKLTKWFFGNFYHWHKNIKFSKIMYLLYAAIIKFIFRRRVIKDKGQVFLLPPTPNLIDDQKKILQTVDLSNNRTFYFCGWLFRNPDGLKKYRTQILEYFKPKERWYGPAQEFIRNLKNKYKHAVGVHIRQGDYKTWQGGQCYFTCQEVRKILDDFLSNQTVYTKDNTVFILCSDGEIDKESFIGLNAVNGLGTEIADLYTLAAMDLIIGSGSTYGPWAAYYGNVPFVQFSRSKIDWSSVLNNKIL